MAYPKPDAKRRKELQAIRKRARESTSALNSAIEYTMSIGAMNWAWQAPLPPGPKIVAPGTGRHCRRRRRVLARTPIPRRQVFNNSPNRPTYDRHTYGARSAASRAALSA